MPRTTARVRPASAPPAGRGQGQPTWAGRRRAALSRARGRQHPHRARRAPFPRWLLPREDRGPVQWAVPRGAQAGLGPLLHRLALLGHPVSAPSTPRGPTPAGVPPLGTAEATVTAPWVWPVPAADAGLGVAGASASWPSKW